MVDFGEVRLGRILKTVTGRKSLDPLPFEIGVSVRHFNPFTELPFTVMVLTSLGWTFIFNLLAGLCIRRECDCGETINTTRVAGIEPAHTVLKTVVLPLNYTP